MSRRILLIVAVVVAVLGAAMVFLYVRGADSRAEAQYDTRNVLKVVTQIEAGESIDAASSAGKIALEPVPVGQILPDALDSIASIQGKVAITTLAPGEQVVASKFGGAEETSALPIEKGEVAISVNLTDPARVAGFVNPGSEVAVFLTGTLEGQATDPASGQTTEASQQFTRLLLERVTVIGVGSTTPVTTQSADPADDPAAVETLPRTLLTLSVNQKDAERVLFAASNGELAFGLLTPDSNVQKDQGTTVQNLFE